MGRFLGKCKGSVGEIAVVGVRTRARAALAMAAGTNAGASLPEKKIKKISATTTRFNFNELRRRRQNTGAPVNSSPSASCRPETTSMEDVHTVLDVSAVDCSTTCEISSDIPASCCSSNNTSTSSIEVVKDTFQIVADPEQQQQQQQQQQVESAETSPRCFNSCPTPRREKKLGTADSKEQDSPPRRPDVKSTVQIKMPSDSEIEEFFSGAEKDLQKRFTDKYNFDIVKDIPLEGRYEWVPIKP